jgi:uncharacterized membrane protein YdjX (TVP38/TMEM64 family)
VTRATLTRWFIFLMLLAATLIGLFVIPRLDVDRWVTEEVVLRDWVAQRRLLAWSLAAGVYTLATALSLPIAAVLSLFLGWLLGFWPALIIVSFSSTAGATGAFLTSRYLIGDWVQRRYANRLAGLNAAIEREGAAYLFMLRLIPYVPFFLINLGMGLTRLPVRTFWWVSQLGMLPGTAVYLFAASSVQSLAVLRRDGLPGLLTPRLILAFVLLGLTPWVLRKLVSRSRLSRSVQSGG